MLAPYILSAVFVISVVALCIAKPNAGRIFLGLFFLAMALGVNGTFVLTGPQFYADYLGDSLIPLYRELTMRTVALNPLLYSLLLVAFELALGILMLGKLKYVKIGLLGTIIFIVALAPVNTLQFVWLGLVVGQVYLLTKEFDVTLLDILRSKWHTWIASQ